MRALVVYESMFGNTRRVAEAIAAGLQDASVTTTLAAAQTSPDPAGYDVVFVGAPTHAHTLPQPTSRAEAASWAMRPEKALTVESTSEDPGVREWLRSVGRLGSSARFAAFATRVDMPRIFTGDASSAISKRLKDAGARHVAKESFLVSSVNVLLDGETERAVKWATGVVAPAPVG